APGARATTRWCRPGTPWSTGSSEGRRPHAKVKSGFSRSPMRQPGVPDIDRILDAIRAEARARGSQGLVGSYGADPAGTVLRESHGLAAPDVRHVADYLALPPDVFLQLAYRQCLGRDPDAGGAAHYQRALLR